MEKSSSEARRYVILKEIYKKKVVSNEDLRDKFGVSLVTIRKDLSELESIGLVNRTFGGAVPILTDKGEEIIAYEGSIQERSERIAITKYIVEKKVVKEGNILFMDGGIIINMLARRLSDKRLRHITVITNAVNVANELGTSGTNVILTGGDMRSEQGILSGNLSNQTIDQYSVDLAFIDVDGLSLGSGLWANDEVAAQIKKRMIKGAKEVIIMAGHSKLGHEVGQLFATFHFEEEKENTLKLMVGDLKDEKIIKIDLLDLPVDYEKPESDDPIQNWFKNTLKEKGWTEPAWVKEKSGGRFEIIDGKRRYLAAKSLTTSGINTLSSIPIKFEQEPLVKRDFKIITSSNYFKPQEEKRYFLNEKRRFKEVSSNIFVDIAD
ncbi:MAG: DeoR family transcriptional regulator [bacterium]|nr:DeoR family transcriptional regulator [bacterium]